MSDLQPEFEHSEAPSVGRPSWWSRLGALRRTVLLTLLVVLATAIALDAWMLSTTRRYQAEVSRLRGSMTNLERSRADAIVNQEEGKYRVAIELLRRQARIDQGLHLSVSVDTGAMYLERDGALLREMPVQIGSERMVGVPPDTVRLAAPRGVRTVARVLTDADAWEVPPWVYTDRGIDVDSSRSIRGALGPAALLLDGGTIVYSMPITGPLNDSGYVLPGAVRARVEDLRAVLPNLTPGMRVYFY
jgi:hypothetical protein